MAKEFNLSTQDDYFALKIEILKKLKESSYHFPDNLPNPLSLDAFETLADYANNGFEERHHAYLKLLVITQVLMSYAPNLNIDLTFLLKSNQLFIKTTQFSELLTIQAQLETDHQINLAILVLNMLTIIGFSILLSYGNLPAVCAFGLLTSLLLTINSSLELSITQLQCNEFNFSLSPSK